MTRLIKIDKDQEKEVTHKKCGAVVGYFENEVTYKVFDDYGGGSDVYGQITCPNCKEIIQWMK